MLNDNENEKKKREELEKVLGAIDEDYEKAQTQNRLPDPPEYEEKTYEKQSDEQIEARAKASLEGERQANISKIEDDATQAEAEKKREKQEVEERSKARRAEIESDYDQATKRTSDDAVTRGLARSSVVVNQLGELERGKLSALALATAEAESALSAIDGEISALREKRQSALNSYNVAYAAKVTEKIAELTDARDKKAAEVVEYNNKMKTQAYEDAVGKVKTESDLETEYLTQKQKEESLSSDAHQSDKNVTKYNVIRDYLATLDKESASEAVKADNLIRSSLTDYYYYKIYNEFCK